MADNGYNIHGKILRSGQYRVEDSRYVIHAPKVFKKTKEQEIDETTQRIEDLHEEIKKLENEIIVRTEKNEKEAEEIIDKAEAEAERIVKEAEDASFERVKKSVEDKDNTLQEKRSEAEEIINEAKGISSELIRNAEIEAEKIKADAKSDGFETGRNEGFEAGKDEIISMNERLKLIIKATLEEREKILVHSEKQIMNLILTMVKKIVKKLTLEEENVVINNTKDALSIIRGAMKVFIHVNPSDFEYTTKHKDELIKMIEGMPEVKVFEDPSVDKGGVFIETDVGDVDAKIATQLDEIENKIRFYMPVKVKTKGIEKEEPDISNKEVMEAEIVNE